MCPGWESSPRGRHAGPTWTAHVPAALAGSHSAPSAHPATAAASAPGYGPRPTVGVNGAESIGVTLGWASLPRHLLRTSHSCRSSVRMILLESNSCLSFEAFQMLSSEAQLLQENILFLPLLVAKEEASCCLSLPNLPILQHPKLLIHPSTHLPVYSHESVHLTIHSWKYPSAYGDIHQPTYHPLIYSATHSYYPCVLPLFQTHLPIYPSFCPSFLRSIHSSTH